MTSISDLDFTAAYAVDGYRGVAWRIYRRPIVCECSDEYGPCEQHSTMLVSREGASLHTADELALIRASDCEDCGAAMTDSDSALYRRLTDQLAEDTDPRSGCGWFADPSDQEAAFELADRMEAGLPVSVRLYADDGYVIVRLSDECPLETEEQTYETDTVTAVMIGDDREFVIDVDDLTAIDDLDYCSECGQIGCGHDGRDRD